MCWGGPFLATVYRPLGAKTAVRSLHPTALVSPPLGALRFRCESHELDSTPNHPPRRGTLGRWDGPDCIDCEGRSEAPARSVKRRFGFAGPEREPSRDARRAPELGSGSRVARPIALAGR